MLKHHLMARLGELRLDQVTYAVIADLKIELAKKPVGNAERRKDAPEPERRRCCGGCWWSRGSAGSSAAFRKWSG